MKIHIEEFQFALTILVSKYFSENKHNEHKGKPKHPVSADLLMLALHCLCRKGSKPMLSSLHSRQLPLTTGLECESCRHHNIIYDPEQ